jgi:aryl-alcohol dehydrogenase-like predicted oxidoreductase
MKYENLGTTGVSVSRLALGTLLLSSFGNKDRGQCVEVILRAVENGINYIDTADSYSDGESESIVGEALSHLNRYELFIATKVGFPIGEGRNVQGASRRWIIAACEASLRRLGIDYIDLYQVHIPSPETDIDDTLGALSDLVHAGKVRYTGSSNFSATEIVEAQWAAARRCRERFRTEQCQYSLVARHAEREILPTCRHHEVAGVAWSPLGAGWLTGDYGTGKANTPRSQPRAEALRTRYDLSLPENQRRLEAVDQIQLVAQASGLSIAQLALAFVLEHPSICSAVIGPMTVAELMEDLSAIDVRLTSEILDRLDEIVPPGEHVGATEETAPALLARNRRRGSNEPRH